MEQTITDRALLRAQLEATPTVTTRYELKIDSVLHERAIKTCERHGVTLAAFLRATCAELVKAYGE